MKKGAINWKIEKVVSKGDYLYAIVRDHPNRTSKNYVLFHRVIVENHLGRLLNSNEIVHHKNHDKKDNRIENLEVMNRSEHTKLHASEVGRKWAELKCPNCDEIFHRELRQTFLQKGAKYTCCSRKCMGKISRKIQLNGETVNVEKAISENLVRVYRKYAHDNSEQTV
jgi:hypothetical protein